MGCFSRFVAPLIRALADLVHRHGVKFMFHSCGSVRDAIPDLIELGVDILNPIQPAAAAMEPEGLKRDFGADLCFHGGVDVQYLLPLDHPIYLGPQAGIEDPARVVALARDHGATAVLLTAGALRRAVDEIGELGAIQFT